MLQGIAALMTGRRWPIFIQSKVYITTVQATTHNVVFDSPPTTGAYMITFVFADNTGIANSSSWTLESSRTINSRECSLWGKIALVGESQTITFTSPSTILVAIAYEFLPFSVGNQDIGVSSIDQSVAANLISNAVLPVYGRVFAQCCYLDVSNATEGPFSFDSGFVNIGYAQAPANGSSAKPIEMVIGYKEGQAATYSTTITSTGTEAATSTPAQILSFT